MKHVAACLGFSITAEITMLDWGADVGIYGGCRTHVGAVTLAEPHGEPKTVLRKGHRDNVITELWAKELSERWQIPVCVRCGIHYDCVTSEQIGEIVTASRQLLAQVLQAESVPLSMPEEYRSN